MIFYKMFCTNDIHFFLKQTETRNKLCHFRIYMGIKNFEYSGDIKKHCVLGDRIHLIYIYSEFPVNARTYLTKGS